MSVAYSAVNDRVPMFRVSLILEALRARPALMFWVAALAQATLWTLVPALFYAAPPGEVPLVLAVGHEWLLGSPYGPPLAYWVGESAFTLGGVAGLYVLAQLCVVVTYWAVFALGRRIVGTAHAAMAILLMAGISLFTVPTVNFGPSVLAMPLTALTLLFGYRAIADNWRGDWLAAGITLGLLLLTSYAGLILLALMTIFVAATAQGRSRLGSIGPWAAATLVLLINFAHLYWLERSGFRPLPMLSELPGMLFGEKRPIGWANLLALLAFSHAGLIVLVLVAGGFLAGQNARAPTVERVPLEPFAKRFVYFFALAPALIATLLAVLLDRTTPVGGAAPLVVLSGLAVVVAAGDRIRLYRQRISALVWLGLLLVPPAVIVAATVTLPWTAAVDLEVSKPANAMGQFFTETFRRRTGKPFAIVIGDMRTAGLVALASPDRPSLYVDGSPELAPWTSDEAVRQKGAIVVWNATETGGAPPAALKARFPEMVAEVPRSFDRSVQGRLPLLRIGWAVIRPQ
ncbi:MAG: glycosyltransferase family 39 protein [Alphaproteobacteria bacterium]|nr:MAG: glycosyltransferase family 39 protein [Alphaproteobacteria bacterium]